MNRWDYEENWKELREKMYKFEDVGPDCFPMIISTREEKPAYQRQITEMKAHLYDLMTQDRNKEA